MQPDNAQQLRLFYTTPGKIWLDALPLGNGRIAAMVHGRVQDECIQLDESTFWSGEASTENVRAGTDEVVEEIRRLLFARDYKAAKALGSQITGDKLNYGTHLPLGNLKLDFDHGGCDQHDLADFTRSLDLRSGVAEVNYRIGDDTYAREVFVSNPQQVLVVNLTSTQAGALNMTVAFEGLGRHAQTHIDDAGDLLIEAKAVEDIHSDGNTGVTLHGRIRILAGEAAVTHQRDTLEIRAADSVILLVALRTTFDAQHPFDECLTVIERAASLPYTTLKANHVEDYTRLMDRVTMRLGESRNDDVPTDVRLNRVKSGEVDPGLDALMFHYGRYLIVASSRENSPLPTHLQGIWNDGLACRMVWTCDMHLDINTQMNYWPAEAAALTECVTPLFDWVANTLVPSGTRTAKALYRANGWTAHVVSNAWGYTAPGFHESWGIWAMGGAWVATHFWEHYLYTGDRVFLEQVAYPVLREAARFALAYLTQHPHTGHLVGGPASSPENPVVIDGEVIWNTMGATCDIVFSREIFNIVIAAADVLNRDRDLTSEIQQALARMPPFKIGKQGQLQEWYEDYDAFDPHHRHISHLLSLFPFSQVSPDKTFDLMDAVRKSLELRLKPDGAYEIANWALALLMLYYARLCDGRAAYHHMQTALRVLTYNNLYVCHPVFKGYETGIYELDGNTGMAAGILEMLVQSHDGVIRLLPALPEAWSQGHVKGIRARGGFEVEIDWRAGQSIKVIVISHLGNPITVKFGSQIHNIAIEAGQSLALEFVNAPAAVN